MRLVATLLVAAAVTSGAAFAAAPRPRPLAAVLRAMHARPGSGYLADHGRRAVMVAATQEAEWKGYVAASVYAAEGHPLRSVRLLRPKSLGGDVTLRFPAVNCACAYPGMNRLHKIRPASRRQVFRTIRAAAQREDARIDRLVLLHPLAYAPVIVVTPRNPRSFMRVGGAPMLVDKLYTRIEGAYVVVRTGGGRVVASGGYTRRSFTAFGEVGWAIPV
jgi:hypothetical protein